MHSKSIKKNFVKWKTSRISKVRARNPVRFGVFDNNPHTIGSCILSSNKQPFRGRWGALQQVEMVKRRTWKFVQHKIFFE